MPRAVKTHPRRLMVCMIVALAVHAAADDSRTDAAYSAPTDATAILWRDPGDVSTKDLFWGPGSAARAPKPPLTFVKEDTGGTKPKVQVTDASGMTWSVKFDAGDSAGPEVSAEIAASRILWALGYTVEETYFVPAGRIEGASGLQRARSVIQPDGSFGRARFESRPPDVKRLSKRWTADDNPFKGSQELSGLLILMAALNNWDFRGANTDVFEIVNSGGVTEHWYVVSDLGTAFGRLGAGLLKRHTRWNTKHYIEEDAFIVRAHSNRVLFYYAPNGRDRLSVPLEQARWFATLWSRLTPAQLRRAFEAAGASPAEIDAFSKRFVEKQSQLRAAAIPQE